MKIITFMILILTIIIINNDDKDNNNGWNIKQYNIHTYYQEKKDSSTIYNYNNNNNVYKMIEPKQCFHEKYSKQMGSWKVWLNDYNRL